MSDLFHKNVPSDFIQSVFKTMNEVPQHTFQVLTKRPDRVIQLNKNIKWTSKYLARNKCRILKMDQSNRTLKRNWSNNKISLYRTVTWASP